MLLPEDRSLALTSRYDREANDYLEFWAPVLRIAALTLIKELAGAPARRVVDVATGVGALLADLRAAFPAATVVGVDRSRGMLALAPAAFPRAAMDAQHLALASASVDVAVYAFMLFHLDEPIRALREARRVLRPGGRIGTLTWGGDLESVATGVWSACLDEHGAGPPDPSAATRHDSVDAPEKVGSLLRAAGFELPRCWAGELVTTIDAEHLIQLRTRLGSQKPRFDALAPDAREACVASARRKFRALGPEDFVAHGPIVYAIGEA